MFIAQNQVECACKPPGPQSGIRDDIAPRRLILKSSCQSLGDVQIIRE